MSDVRTVRMLGTLGIQTPLGYFDVYGEGTITRALLDGQWWDDHLKPVLDEAERGGVAIDIGAHFGWFTVYLATRHDKVIAVEPWIESFQLLLRNIEHHHIKGVMQAFPMAAYNKAAILEFAPGNDTTDAGSFGFTPTADTGAIPSLGGVPLAPSMGDPRYVPAMPLDLYIPDTELVNVIKCDAQGADLKALKGLRYTIARCRPLIVFEWEEGMAAWQGDSWQDYLDFFGNLGYTVERITPDYWDYVARPRPR